MLLAEHHPEVVLDLLEVLACVFKVKYGFVDSFLNVVSQSFLGEEVVTCSTVFLGQGRVERLSVPLVEVPDLEFLERLAVDVAGLSTNIFFSICVDLERILSRLKSCEEMGHVSENVMLADCVEILVMVELFRSKTSDAQDVSLKERGVLDV